MPPRPPAAFPLRRIYFRNDRLVLPKVRLPARPINEHDGWCDDPRAPTYNRLVHIPNEWSHEKMWRDDGLYDLVVVVGYNDDPPEGEWGSAIFLHIARDDYSPTQGCVAFARDDLLELVALIGPETRINVLSLPASETAPQRARRAGHEAVRGFRRKGLVVGRSSFAKSLVEERNDVGRHLLVDERAIHAVGIVADGKARRFS